MEDRSSGDHNVAVQENTISEDEKAVYDRQIRLWGIEAQNRLRNSSVLIAGLTGCGCEVAKNLMLAGLKSLTLIDNQTVTANDYYSQFLLQAGSEGENRAEASRQKCQVLNPNVKLSIDTENIAEKNEEFFTNFDLIIIVDQKYSIVSRISKICRNAKKPFIAGGVYGWVGYAFFDFTDCSFLVTKPKIASGGALDDDLDEAGPSFPKKQKVEYDLEKEDATNGNEQPDNVVLDDESEKVKVTFKFPLWDDAWNVDWSHKKLVRKTKRILPRSYFPVRVMLRLHESGEDITEEKFMEFWMKELRECNHVLDDKYFDAKYFLQFNDPQLSSTCAVVGAHISQEAVKVLSQMDYPLRNVFLYSAIDTSGILLLLPPYFS